MEAFFKKHSDNTETLTQLVSHLEANNATLKDRLASRSSLEADLNYKTGQIRDLQSQLHEAQAAVSRLKDDILRLQASAAEYQVKLRNLAPAEQL